MSEWFINYRTMSGLGRTKKYKWINKQIHLCTHKYVCAVLSHRVVSDSLQPHGLQPTRLLCPWGFSRQEYWSGLPCPPPRNLPKSGIEPTSATLQVDSLPSEPPGKPKNTEAGTLSILQGIFQTQESNWGLLHCRWILYQLSYQESPKYVYVYIYIYIKTQHSKN